MSTMIAAPRPIDTQRTCPAWCAHDDCTDGVAASAPVNVVPESPSRTLEAWVQQSSRDQARADGCYHPAREACHCADLQIVVLHEWNDGPDPLRGWRSESVTLPADDLRWLLSLPTEQLDQIRALLDQTARLGGAHEAE